MTGGVRVSQEGVFDGDQKVADLTQTHRGDVLEITEVSPRHLGRKIAIIAAVVGGLILLLLAATWGAIQEAS